MNAPSNVTIGGSVRVGYWLPKGEGSGVIEGLGVELGVGLGKDTGDIDAMGVGDGVICMGEGIGEGVEEGMGDDTGIDVCFLISVCAI